MQKLSKDEKVPTSGNTNLPPRQLNLHQSRDSDRSRKKKSNFAGILGTKSRKNPPISREFRGNFRGKLGLKAIGKKTADLWLYTGQILLEIDRFLR